eukprot:4693214-Pyramimonas_sp.AAC.1
MLDQAYLKLIDKRPLAACFNHETALLLAANVENDAQLVFQKKAFETRPLFRGNTDNKMFASLICAPFGQQPSRFLSKAGAR